MLATISCFGMAKVDTGKNNIKLYLSTTIEELLTIGLITKRTYLRCKYNLVLNVGMIMNLSNSEILSWRGSGKKVLSELENVIQIAGTPFNKSSSKNSRSNDSEDLPPILIKVQNSLFCYSVLSKIVSLIQAGEESWKALSVQQINLLSCCLDPSSSDDLQYNEKVAELLDIYSNPEFQSILELFEKDILALVSVIDSASDKIKRVLSDFELKRTNLIIVNKLSEALYIKRLYPLLETEDIEFCIKYHIEHLEWPTLYIIYKSLVLSKERKAQILCHRYGLYTDSTAKSLEEIASIYDLTRERIRQLTDSDGSAIYSLIPDDIVRSCLEGILYLSEEDDYIKETIYKQNLKIQPNQLIMLLDLISPNLISYRFVKGGRIYVFDK